MVVTRQGELSQKAGSVEYKMSNLMAKQILGDAKRKGIKKRPQEILVNYVNRECGLKGHCTKVLIDL